MIIEDFFTRHTGDTSFFYLDMNAIVDISLTHFFTSWKWKLKCRGGFVGVGVQLLKKKDISFFVECMHVFMESINQYLLHIE